MGKKIVTAGGLKEDKENCRLISGLYYKIGVSNIKDSGECYMINDRFYKSTTGYIEFDHEIGEYVIKKMTTLISGVINITEKNELEFGMFSLNPINNVEVQTELGSTHVVLSYKLFKNRKKYREVLSTGIFMDISKIPARKFSMKLLPDSRMKQDLVYDSRNILGEAIVDYDKYYKSTITKKVKTYAPMLQDLTFGLEFETIKGFIPLRICRKLGLIPLRDGSVSGLEYVTIPLQGKKGVQTVLDSLYHLKARTDFDYSCSLHLHIGNIPRTMEFMVAMYKTLVHFQDEIYEMFPLYKKYNWGYKRKNYTKPLDPLKVFSKMDYKITDGNIVDNFDILYHYLSMGQGFKGNFKNIDEVTSHPSDPHGTSKWNIKSRYHWVNLIPLLFGNKETVEFRIHTSTFNADKVMNYMFICSTLVNYVKNNTTSILNDFESSVANYNLSMIMQKELRYFSQTDASEDLIQNLRSYIQSRQEYVKNSNRNSKIHFAEKDVDYYSRIKWQDDEAVADDTFKKLKGSAFARPNIGYGSAGARTRRGLVNHINAELGSVVIGNEPEPESEPSETPIQPMSW